jgi:hypothetical protein
MAGIAWDWLIPLAVGLAVAGLVLLTGRWLMSRQRQGEGREEDGREAD